MAERQPGIPIAIEGIRAKVDAIVYPTIPILGSGYAGEDAS